MTEHLPLNFEGQRVRVVFVDGEPWFVAADVCRALGLMNSRDAVGRLDADGVGNADVIDSLGRTQSARVVSEAGLYELIFQSRVPRATGFRRWVTREVLPSIRKTGSYGATDPLAVLSDPATLRQLLGDYAGRVLALEEEARVSRPKAEVYDRIVDSGGTVGFREAAKLIHAGTGAREPEVRDLMLRRGWIQRLGGRLAPAHYGQTRGYVTVRDREVLTCSQEKLVVPELRVTQRGVTRAVEVLLVEIAQASRPNSRSLSAS